MVAAVEATADVPGLQAAGEFLLAQPSVAAALAAEPLASRPMEGKLGRSRGLA